MKIYKKNSNKKYFITIKTNLITNFKPNNFKNIKNYDHIKFNFNNFSKEKSKGSEKRIFCKNFFIFLILLKYKNNNIFKKSNIFIKKFKKKIYTILRAPYRHKLTRHQISINRYEINSSIFITLKKPFFVKNWARLTSFFFFIKKFTSFFESNIIYVKNINIAYYIFFQRNFFIL